MRSSDLPPTAHRPLPTRSGISLLEVLISMFVLLFGLMGVAAIFPVGNHYAGKSEQYDRGSALADAAFSDLKARGLLQPRYWLYADNTPLMNASTGWFQIAPPNAASDPGPGYAYVLDPVGAAEVGDGDTFFPYGGGIIEGGVSPDEWQNPTGSTPPLAGRAWPIRRVTLPQADGNKMLPRIAEAIFRLHDDLSVELPEKDDLPSMQRWSTDNNGTPNNKLDDLPLARDYVGSYSWLATVLPTSFEALNGMQPADPRYGSFLYEVSVAIFHKREEIPDTSTERLLGGELYLGGDLVMYAPGNDVSTVDAAMEDIRAGQWIALAGVHPTTGKFLIKWYRLLSVEDETTEDVDLVAQNGVAGRHAMLDGPEWPTLTDANGAPIYPVQNLRAILLPGVIGVTTQTLELSTESSSVF